MKNYCAIFFLVPVFFLSGYLGAHYSSEVNNSDTNMTSELSDGDLEISHSFHGCRSIHRPWKCRTTMGCRWSWRREMCMNKNGGGGGYHRPCYEVYGPRRCEYRRDCRWSHRRNRCVNRWR